MKQRIQDLQDLSEYDESDLLVCLTSLIAEIGQESCSTFAKHIARNIKNFHESWIIANIQHLDLLYNMCVNSSPSIRFEMAKLLHAYSNGLSQSKRWHLNRIRHSIEYIKYLEANPSDKNPFTNLPFEIVSYIFRYMTEQEIAYFYMSCKRLYAQRSYQFKKKQILGTCFINQGHIAVSISRLLNSVLNDSNFHESDFRFIQSSMVDLVDYTSNDNARETLIRIYRNYPDLLMFDFRKDFNSRLIGFPSDILVQTSRYYDTVLESFIRNSRNGFTLLWNIEKPRAALLKAMFYTTTGLEDAIGCGLNIYRHIADTADYLGMALFNCLLLENTELFFKLVFQFGSSLVQITELPKSWFSIETSHEYRRNSVIRKQINAMFDCILKNPLNLNFKVFSHLSRIVCLKQYEEVLKKMVDTTVPDPYFRDLCYYLCGSSLELKCIAINKVQSRPQILQADARNAEALVHAIGIWDLEFAKYLCEFSKVRSIIRQNPKDFFKRCIVEKSALMKIKPSDAAILIFLKSEASRDSESDIELSSDDEDEDEESWN